MPLKRHDVRCRRLYDVLVLIAVLVDGDAMSKI